MKEFKVNEYITLKLEGKKTNIFVNGKLFNQCKFLLLNIPIDKISNFDDIESIDEAAEKLDRSMEGEGNIKYEIPLEVQFWGHCSNIQAWAENNYDTRFLDSNLSFPLLKKLTEVGDPMANKVFKEEIAKRLTSGYAPVIKYLIKEKYVDYLSEEELESLEIQIIKINRETIRVIGNVLNLISKKLTTLPESIGNLKSLQSLYLGNNQLTTLPESIGNLKSLKKLYLWDNQLTTLPESIGNLKSLQSLFLGNNQLTTLPESIGTLSILLELDLRGNQLTNLPESIGNLKSLQTLILSANPLVALPESIGNLKSLQSLYLDSLQTQFLNKDPESLKVITELKKKGVSLTSELEKTLSTLSQRYLQENRLEDVIDICNKLLSRDPNNFDGLHTLARALKRKGEFEKTLELYTKCLDLRPENHYVWSNIAEVYDKLENYKQSLEFANKAIELNPETYAAYFYRGNAYLAEGNPETSSGRINLIKAYKSYYKALQSPIKGNFKLTDDVIKAKIPKAYLEKLKSRERTRKIHINTMNLGKKRSRRNI